MGKKLPLSMPTSWTLPRVFLRGVFLVVSLCWFAHFNLTSQTITAPEEEVEPFLARLARKANATEQQVQIILEELGPAMNQEFARGNHIHLPGLGDFQAEQVSGLVSQNPHGVNSQGTPAFRGIRFHPAVAVPGSAKNPDEPKRNIN